MGDTAHLTTEEIGAYLLLMLAYYRTEEPLPARDRALASITKLPMDRWQEAKLSIAPFFVEEDGVWRHARIDAEIKDRAKKHATAVANATSGARKRWGDRATAKPAEKPNDTKRKAPGNAAGVAAAMPPAMPPAQQPLCTSTSTTTDNSLSTRVRAREGKMDLQEKEPDDEDDIGTPIDPKFWPSANRIAVCKFDHADDATINAEVAAFIDNKRSSGAFSNDWDASWGIWWKRWQEHRKKQAKQEAKQEAKPTQAQRAQSAVPRTYKVDLPPQSPLEQYVPTVVELDRTIPMWLTGARWPRNFGPEPGQIGCRVPRSVLEKHGIDPKTGMKLSKPKPEKV